VITFKQFLKEAWDQKDQKKFDVALRAQHLKYLTHWVYVGLNHPEQDSVEMTKENILKGILGIYKKAAVSDAGGLKYTVEEMMSYARKLNLDSPEEFATIEKHMDDAIASRRR